jgi:hypothetical protein
MEQFSVFFIPRGFFIESQDDFSFTLLSEGFASSCDDGCEAAKSGEVKERRNVTM